MLIRPEAQDIRNVVYQQIIDNSEIDEALKMAKDDMERERAGSPCFETNSIGTPAQITPQAAIDKTPAITSTGLNVTAHNTSAPARGFTPKIFSNDTPRNKCVKSNWGDFKPEQVKKRGNVQRKNVKMDGNCLFRLESNICNIFRIFSCLQCCCLQLYWR